MHADMQPGSLPVATLAKAQQNVSHGATRYGSTHRFYLVFEPRQTIGYAHVRLDVACFVCFTLPRYSSLDLQTILKERFPVYPTGRRHSSSVVR